MATARNEDKHMSMTPEEYKAAAADELAAMARDTWHRIEQRGGPKTFAGKRPEQSQRRSTIRAAFRGTLQGPSVEARDAWLGNKPWHMNKPFPGQKRTHRMKKEIVAMAARQLRDDGTLQAMEGDREALVDISAWANTLRSLVE